MHVGSSFKELDARNSKVKTDLNSDENVLKVIAFSKNRIVLNVG